MRNLFVPVFLVCLIFPACFHTLGIVNHSLIYWWFAMTPGTALVCLYFKKYRSAYLLLVIALGLLIGGRFLEEKNSFNQTILQISGIPSGQYVTLEGRVTSFPEINRPHSTVYMAVNRVRWGKQYKKLYFNIRLKIKGGMGHLNRGDWVSIDAAVYKPSHNHNFSPNPMEYLQWVRRIHANGFCKSAGLVVVTAKSNRFWRVVGGWRHKIRTAIETKYKPEASPLDRRGVLLQALLTGERTSLSNREKDRLTGAGVYHLLAISGAHIGIIAMGCLVLLKLLRISLKKRYIITAILLVLFLVLSGSRVSAERAVLMALLLFTARIFGLEKNLYNIISFCGILLLVKNPAAFMDAGFVLTFTLTVIIVTGRKIVPPLLKQTGWKLFINQPSYLAQLLSANLSASLAALPLSLFFFKRYSFAGFMAGLILVPLTGVILGLGFILIPLALLSNTLCQWLLMIIDLPLRLFFLMVTFFSDTLNLSIYNASPPVLVVILIPGLFCLIPKCRSAIQKILITLLVLLLCVGISLNLFPYSPRQLEVFFLDVGQGDAQIVVFPGGNALLIDGGGVYYSDFQVGRGILLPFILQKRIRIKWIAVSHYHADHMRGINEIIHILKPEQLWLSSKAPQNRMYLELMEKTPESTVIRHISAPFQFTLEGCRVLWLHPPKVTQTGRSGNNHSQVINISDGFHSFLFTGDIETESEKIIKERFCRDLRADVLKVPHHGSATSSSTALLDCVKPRLAVFSYARYNRFGFPHQKVIERFKGNRIPYLSTARNGGIHMVSLPDRIKIRYSTPSAVFSFE